MKNNFKVFIFIILFRNRSSFERIKNDIEDSKATSTIKSSSSLTAKKDNVKKRKLDAKTQHLLDSSRKLGRRLISMDIESLERRDKKHGTRKTNQSI